MTSPSFRLPRLAGTLAAISAACLPAIAGARAGRPAAGGSGIRETVGRRTVAVARSQAVIQLWQQGAEHYYSLSLDGGRTIAIESPTTYLVRAAYAEFDPLLGEPAIPDALRAGSACGTYMVQFIIPPIEEFRRDLVELGATVERFMTDHVHVVKMDATTAARVAALPYVRWVGPYHPAYRLSADVRAELLSGTDAGAMRYSIECMERGPSQQQAIADFLKRVGGIVEVLTPDQYRMEATLTREQLLALVSRDEINYIDPWGGPGGTDLILNRQLVGAVPTLSNAGISGQGVRGEVFDTEVRTTHVAFQNPAPLLRFESAGSAANAHGSACYGINFAKWTGNSDYDGLCRDREQGIFCDYTLASQFGGSHSRLSMNREAIDLAGPYRSSYQTSSVGNAQVTVYTTISAEVDDYLMRADYLSCQSQSNTGNQNSRPQAWAKNIVSVGGLSWQNTVSRADDAWATGASCGPAADNRVKPDLINCFDHMLTTWNDSDTSTTDFSGTSGATPLTAGCFGLLQQAWYQGVWTGHGGGSSIAADHPCSALAKALMINTAFRYPLNQGGLTRAKQGWGLPDLTNMYNIRAKTFLVNGDEPLATGQTATYHLWVLAGEPAFAATMAFIDPQGNPAAAQARVNDLSLKVTSPTGTIYWGNNGLNASNVSTTGGSANTIDTVGNVFLQNPAAGDWTIQVIATSVVQDAYLATPAPDAIFGLAVTGGQPALTFVLPNGLPELISPSTPTNIDVQILPGAQTVQPGTAVLKYRFSSSGSFQTVPLTSLGGNDYRAAIPPPACSDNPQFYFSVTGNLGTTITLPSSAPTSNFTAIPGTGYIVAMADDFEADQGWSPAAPEDTAASGRWTRNVPQETEAQPGEDHSPTGTVCWCTDYRAGQQVSDFDVDGGRTTLTTPLFNMQGLRRPTISYWRWYSNGVGPLNPHTNVLVVDISNDDGISWLNAETVGPDGPETVGGWIQHIIDVGALLTPTDRMRIRFIVADETDSIVEAAIDDFLVRGVECTQTCYPNCDQSTTPPILNVTDFVCFLNRFAAGDNYANCDQSTTPPVLNVLDFTCYLNAFAAGCT